MNICAKRVEGVILLIGFAFAACGNAAISRERLIIKMERASPKGNLATVEIDNPTTLRWCLVPVSFSTSQFQLFLNNKRVQNKSVNLSLSTKCLYIAPGERKRRVINLSNAFAEEQLRVGKLCYTFSYGTDEPRSKIAADLGTICEGRRGARYLAPTFAGIVPEATSLKSR